MHVSSWQFDKKIPVVTIFLFMVQVVGLVVFLATWKATTDAQIQALNKAVEGLQVYAQGNDKNRVESVEKFARLEERFASMDSKLGDIRDQLIFIRKTP